MRLSLLTSSPHALPLLEALTREQFVEVICCSSPIPNVAASLSQAFPLALQCAGWDDMLPSQHVSDALLICGDHPAIIEGARVLASVDRPTLLLIDPEAPPAAAFALDELIQEGRVCVTPIAGSGLSTTILQAAEDVKEPISRIELSESVTTSGESDGDLSDAVIERRFFFAAFALRALGGDIEDVTAVKIGQRDGRSREALVTLTAHSPIDLIWRLTPGDGECRLTLQSVSGNTRITTWNRQERIVVDLQQELAASVHQLNPAPVFQWTDLVKAGELAVAVRDSLARRRSIKLIAAEGSERTQFKSQMTAIGCGLLAWTLFGTVLMLLIAAALDPRDREYRNSSQQGFVVHDHRFQMESAEPTHDGADQLKQIRQRWYASEAAVIVEGSPHGDDELAERRRQRVIKELEGAGLREVDGRVVTRSLPGQRFESWFRWGWLVVFFPLMAFLTAQMLILAARAKSTGETAR